MKWSEVVHCPYNMTITRSALDYTFQQPFIEAGGIVTKLYPSWGPIGSWKHESPSLFEYIQKVNGYWRETHFILQSNYG